MATSGGLRQAGSYHRTGNKLRHHDFTLLAKSDSVFTTGVVVYAGLSVEHNLACWSTADLCPWWKCTRAGHMTSSYGWLSLEFTRNLVHLQPIVAVARIAVIAYRIR